MLFFGTYDLPDHFTLMHAVGDFGYFYGFYDLHDHSSNICVLMVFTSPYFVGVMLLT